MVLIPFLLFIHTIGWVVYVHHIAPDIRWWPRKEWNRFKGQVEGTTILWGPPGWDFFFHWIMVHIPHHVDARIPCYRLPEASRAIAQAFPDRVDERRLRMRDYLAATRVCKLHDFNTGQWLPYPGSGRPNAMTTQPMTRSGLRRTPAMYDLQISDRALPLLEAVKKFLDTEIEPATAEFHRLGEGRS